MRYNISMKYILIKSRHTHKDIFNMPAIFDKVTSDKIFDFDYHKKIIHSKLKHAHEPVKLYVTGLTPLLISVINYCKLFDITLTLYHYDTSNNRYRAQSVI